MELYSSQFSLPSPVGAAAPPGQRIQFLRILSLVVIIIFTQISTVSALNSRSPTATTNLSDDNGRSVVDILVNSTSELGASFSNKLVRDDIEAKFHRRNDYRRRFQASSYVRAAYLRNQQQQQQQNQTKYERNLRKLSAKFGCLANPTVCLTAPGWTVESTASTCCHSGWCTDIYFDGLNCGGCGTPCKVGHFCCSGVCVALAIDPRNCGKCGTVCRSGTCAFGLCSYSSIDFVINSTDSE